MGRSERDIFNDHVTSLLRQVGIHLEDLDRADQRRLLSEARDRRCNDHEAALLIAYALIPALLEDDVEQGRVLVGRLEVTTDAWADEELVDRRRLRDSESAARQALRRAMR
jgi:hypothetical protein